MYMGLSCWIRDGWEVLNWDMPTKWSPKHTFTNPAPGLSMLASSYHLTAALRTMAELPSHTETAAYYSKHTMYLHNNRYIFLQFNATQVAQKEGITQSAQGHSFLPPYTVLHSRFSMLNNSFKAGLERRLKMITVDFCFTICNEILMMYITGHCCVIYTSGSHPAVHEGMHAGYACWEKIEN